MTTKLEHLFNFFPSQRDGRRRETRWCCDVVIKFYYIKFTELRKIVSDGKNLSSLSVSLCFLCLEGEEGWHNLMIISHLFTWSTSYNEVHEFRASIESEKWTINLENLSCAFKDDEFFVLTNLLHERSLRHPLIQNSLNLKCFAFVYYYYWTICRLLMWNDNNDNDDVESFKTIHHLHLLNC